MILLKSLSLPMGTAALPFNLPDPNGQEYNLASFADKKALVIIFMCNHCPYVQAVIQRLVTLQADYAEKGVQLVGINSNDFEQYPDDSPEKMKQFIDEKGINFPYLIDKSQAAAKAYQAQCTPDIYVFNKHQKLVYHGRIDDNWQDESAVIRQDLRMALDALITDQPIPNEQHPGMGCSIKWKN
jgi:peroxiredoxin